MLDYQLIGRIRQSILIHPTPLQIQPQSQSQRLHFSFFLQNKLPNKEGTDGTDESGTGIENGNGRDDQEPRTTVEYGPGG